MIPFPPPHGSLRPPHTGVPWASFVLPKIEPELRWNMQVLRAVLRAHAPPSCWSNEVASENMYLIRTDLIDPIVYGP